jgi:uncharacterized protein
MQYRKFGKLDWKSSALGFGAMRFPTLINDPGKIDETESIRMLRYAIDHGVNYIDSAYVYFGGGSEVLLGKALKEGYRTKVKIATKIPSWMVNSQTDYDRMLNEEMKRLQVDKIDFYLFHRFDQNTWPRVRDMGMLKWAEKAMSDGRIGGTGFSFHADFDVLKNALDYYDNWTLAQIQYNYMDEEFQAGTKGLEYIHKKGLAAVIMEPIRGGRLANPTEKVAKIWAEAKVKRTPAEWALRWVWNHPEVSVVLSGMSTMQQVVENVAAADNAKPHSLTAEELALIGKARDTYLSLGTISCTACRYCDPCPSGVDIPGVFKLFNEAVIYNNIDDPRFQYSNELMFKKENRADNCTRCEQCLEKCPQHLQIPDLLEKADALLTGKK